MHLFYFTFTISDIGSMIDFLVKTYEALVQLLCSIHRIERNNTVTIISETDTNTTQFSNSKRLCYWAVLTSDNNEAVDRMKFPRITQG